MMFLKKIMLHVHSEYHRTLNMGLVILNVILQVFAKISENGRYDTI